MDKYSVCVGSTVYNEQNKQIARDVDAKLPAATMQTVDLKALGTISVPVAQLLDDMEMTITHIGENSGLFETLKPGSHKIEVRWAREVFDANGNAKTIGCRAALTVMPKVIAPELQITVGENTECEVPLSVSRYKLYVDGKEKLLIDKFKGICKIDGKDYGAQVASVL